MTAWRDELRDLLRLALPAMATQFGQMAMGVVDTIVVGRASKEALSAMVIGHGYQFAMIAFGMGVLLAIDPIVSQAVGARDRPAVARGFQRGALLALVLAAPLSVGLLFAAPALRTLGVDAELVPLASEYARVSIASVLPFLWFVVIRHTLQAMHLVRAILVTTILANVLNALLDWVFVYGNWGFPAWGAAGSALATAICRWAMLAGLLVLTWREIRDCVRPWRRESLRLGPLFRTFTLGVPIGFQLLVEVCAFAVIPIVLGGLAEDAAAIVAAHGVALNLASIAFMAPLGISFGSAVRVGHAIGAGDAPRARNAARVTVGLAVVCALTFASAFRLFPESLARIYTDDPTVLPLAVTLVGMAGLFAVFDALQVIGAGILRGAGDTRVPPFLFALGFWGLGFPTGWWLCMERGWGAIGMWWGLTGGLATVAVLLLARIRQRLAGPLARLRVDGRAAAPDRVAES